VIKAGLIYNFAKYVEWLAGTFPTGDAPIVIGVLGNDSFAATLGEVVEGKKINGRRLMLKKLRWSKDPKDLKELKDCNMLYVAAAEAAHGDEVIQMLKGAPILTIGDFPDFARHGGIINFILEDSKVRFEVNVDAAKQSDLNISSYLLGSAKIVPTGMSWR
jgi:hypothetical protein